MGDRMMDAEEYANVRFRTEVSGEAMALITAMIVEHVEEHPEDLPVLGPVTWTRVQ